MRKLLAFIPLLLFAFPAQAQAATLSLDALVSFIIYLVIVGLIFWLIWWFVGYVGVPEPFNKVLRVVIGLVALIIVINLLLGLAGHPFIALR